MNWNESIIAFFLTLTLFGAGFVALFVPWRFILSWTTRTVVWVFLGPWMWIMDRFFHEETEHHKKKARKKARQLFHQQQQLAKSLQENALKVIIQLYISSLVRIIFLTHSAMYTTH